MTGNDFDDQSMILIPDAGPHAWACIQRMRSP